MKFIELNKKGDIGDVVFFMIGIGILVGVLLTSVSTVSSISTSSKISDYPASVSTIADAIIGSPNCLLYVTQAKVGTTEYLSLDRGIIDWGKISSARTNCIGKGPYVWKVEATDTDTGDTKEVGSVCSSKPAELEKTVLIKKGNDIDEGTLKIEVDSKDFEAGINHQKGKYDLTITNTGTCKLEYYYEVSIIDSDGNVNNQFKVCGPSVCGAGVSGSTSEISPDDSDTVEITIEDINNLGLAGYILKVVIYPDGLNNYKKELDYNL